VAFGKNNLMRPNLQLFAAEDFCYLTTIGRVTARPHTIEIWFALDSNSLYMLSGSHTSDWVKNLMRAPDVTVRLGDALFAGRARVVEQADEDALARHLVLAKYQPRTSDDLAEWAQTALPVAVDLADRAPAT
jgi:deazaflavin-dependent oxidoreductase (nitroreductase family)